MGSSKAKHLYDHLDNPAFHDELCPVVLSPGEHRLMLAPEAFVGDWGDVARFISISVGSRTAWFPDANVAFLYEAGPVWDALRLAGLGLSEASTIFTATVCEELYEWLAKPRHHQDRAHAIHTALTNETWAKGFTLQDEPTILPAIFGYCRLLMTRRCLAIPTPDERTIVDTDPEKKCETMNAIVNIFGNRAVGLAKKGRLEAENNRQINLNDEMHCLAAICHSLLTRRESVIVTADEDFMEIFHKTQWFLDTHYRAYLAAKMVKEGRFGKPVRELQKTHDFFDGPLTLYRRRSNHLREVLPSVYESVHVRVMYVAPDKTIHTLSFPFELGMLDMLEMRSKTRGRCTDLFREKNIHVDLGPLTVDLDGLYLGIGRDAGDWVQTNDTKTFRSRLDTVHAMNCRERRSIVPFLR